MTHYRKVSALFAILALCIAVLAGFFGLPGSHHTAYAASHIPSCDTGTLALENPGDNSTGYFINVYSDGDSTLTGSGYWYNETSGKSGSFTPHPPDGYGVTANLQVDGSGTFYVKANLTWNSGASCSTESGYITI